MPEGQETPTEWEFDPARVRQSAAEMIEKRSGLDYDKWVDAIQGGSSSARKVLLWHLMRQTHHTLSFADVPDFFMGEVEIDYSIADLQTLRVRVEASSLPDDEKTARIERLDLELANRLSKEELTPDDLGKAPASDAE